MSEFKRTHTDRQRQRIEQRMQINAATRRFEERLRLAGERANRPRARFALGELVQGLSHRNAPTAMAEGRIIERVYNGAEWVYRFAGDEQIWPEQCLRRCDGTTWQQLMESLKAGGRP